MERSISRLARQAKTQVCQRAIRPDTHFLIPQPLHRATSRPIISQADRESEYMNVSTERYVGVNSANLLLFK
jgi:hypothetical protein